MGQILDVGLLILLLVPAGLLLWLPLIGKRWSAIISYLIFGSGLGSGLILGLLLLSEPPAGDSHRFARIYLWVAINAAVMILLTFFVYRHRQRKAKNPANPSVVEDRGSVSE
jgi:hypothetical protein